MVSEGFQSVRLEKQYASASSVAREALDNVFFTLRQDAEGQARVQVNLTFKGLLSVTCSQSPCSNSKGSAAITCRQKFNNVSLFQIQIMTGAKEKQTAVIHKFCDDISKMSCAVHSRLLDILNVQGISKSKELRHINVPK